ncbi:MAG: pirin family protein [Rikenellaceae bacterium]|nr:pirin family protein [Rikenellaceae bacterium]
MAGIDYAIFITPELAANHRRESTVETKVIHRASMRTYLNEGWLQSYRTFSYAGCRDPERMCFGKLRVLNEDTVAPGAALPYYHTENMEIVYIPLEGAMQHYDALGNTSVIRSDEVHLVSAGSGIVHSAYNANRDRKLKFLQIWVSPERKGTEPYHKKLQLDTTAMRNNLSEILSPDICRINQKAWISMGKLDRDYEVRYRLHSRHNGIYIYLIKGEAAVNGERLRSNDGVGLWETRCVDIRAETRAEVLVMEVPMA